MEKKKVIVDGAGNYFGTIVGVIVRDESDGSLDENITLERLKELGLTIKL